jgi:hypothetical protein
MYFEVFRFLQAAEVDHAVGGRLDPTSKLWARKGIYRLRGVLDVAGDRKATTAAMPDPTCCCSRPPSRNSK